MAKEIKDKRLKNLGEGTSFVVITNHEVSWLCRSLVRTMPRWITVGGPKRTNNLSNRIYENRWGINNRVYVSSFLLHSPSDDFVPIWCFRVTVPLPTCVPSHERKKNTVEYRPELFLCPFFILERTCIHFVPIQRLILTQTLKLHYPTRSLSQRGTTVLSACLSVSINSPQAAMLHASSSIDVQILRVVLCQMHRNCILIASHLSTREIRVYRFPFLLSPISPRIKCTDHSMLPILHFKSAHVAFCIREVDRCSSYIYMSQWKYKIFLVWTRHAKSS